MSEPFIAEIRMFGFDWAPPGWAMCDGQVLPIAQNQALYAVIGDIYGGNGTTTLGLPDLRGRVPLDMGAGYPLGQSYGFETVKLTVNDIPSHDHSVNGVDETASTNDPANAVLAKPENSAPIYAQGLSTSQTATNPQALEPAGGTAPHNNMQPSIVVNFCIALSGYFPSRN